MGLEFELPLQTGAQGHNWYAAADLSATQEGNWAVNVDPQFGLALRREERGVRAAIEFYDSRIAGRIFSERRTPSLRDGDLAGYLISRAR